MLIDDMINEVIDIADLAIEDLVNKQLLINENTERIIGIGDISSDKELAKQVNENKRKNNEITSDLIEWYSARGDLIQLQSNYLNKSKNEEISWESLVERLNEPKQREIDNRWVSLFVDSSNKVLDDLGRTLCKYGDGDKVEWDYPILTPELVLERKLAEEAANEE